jgi:hypothetical protein
MSMVNNRRCKLVRTALLAAALAGGNALAVDGDPGMFSFSGFGTLGIVHSSEDRADFTSTASKPRGAGYSRAWSAEPDSLVAAQVTALLGERFSAVLQVVSEQNHDHTYRPHVEWANVKYQVTPDLSVRLGRTVLPVLMLAESRKVGFSNPWVRPPVEVYGLVPVTSNDGVDASYRIRVGDGGSNIFHLAGGRTDTEFPAATSEARKLLIFDDTFEYGFATIRFNVGRASVTVDSLDPLMAAFRQFGPEGTAIADKYAMKDRPVTFTGVGASYDPGAWFVMGEWSRIVGGGVIGRKSAWYASGGYRIDRITPYVTYGRARADNLSDPGLTLAFLPPQLAQPANALNSALNSSLSSKIVQHTLSVGTRWDVARNTALKVQYDHTSVAPGSNGALGNLQPGFQTGGKLDLISASVDFIFR